MESHVWLLGFGSAVFALFMGPYKNNAWPQRAFYSICVAALWPIWVPACAVMAMEDKVKRDNEKITPAS